MTTHDDVRKRLARRGALLLALLRREDRGLRGRILLWGGLRILSTAALGAAVLVALAALRPALARPLGLLVPAAAWAGLAYLVWRHWVRPLRAIPNLAVFARLVEERRGFHDLLRAALEFTQRGAAPEQSLDLVAATVDRAHDEASALRLTQLFEFTHRRRHALLALGGAAVLAALAVLAPASPGRALAGLAFRWPAPGDIGWGPLVALSGDRTVLAGEDVEVAAREHGPRAPEMVLRFNDTGDLWKSRALAPATAGDPRDYVFRFEDVRADMVYRFESGRRRTAEHRVRVVQRPLVSQLQLRLVPPAYTGRPPADLEEGRGDAMALVGTRVEIVARASSPLASAHVVPDGDPTGQVTLTGPLPMRVERRECRSTFVLRSDLRYHFDLVDSLGHGNAEPVTYQLGAVEDRPPYVEIRVPGQDVDLPQSLEVPLGVYAADDFGISRVTLAYRRERDGEAEGESPWKRRDLALRAPGATDPEGGALGAGPHPEVLLGFTWTVDDLGLFPGDRVAYYVEVEDNDDVSGHKTARSSVYRLRLQTVSEMYAKIQEQDENRQTQIDDALEKGRQLRDKYEKLARELKKKPELDWRKEEEIRGALEKQKQLSDQVEKLAEELQEDVERMQQQQLVSEEIVQKLDEIRKLMEEVQDETLREYMERLQEAMKQISPEEIQRAMEKMELSQEEFLKRLERTKALLEQLKREQELDAMIERVAELLRDQEKLGRETEELQGERPEEKGEGQKDEQNERREAEDLAREQNELGDETSELQRDLEQLAEESSQAGQSQLEEPNRELQEQNPSGQMSEASRELSQRQPQAAQPHQQNAERSLRSLYQDLMQAQQSMSMRAQAEAAEKLQKAARQALDVSFRQEGVTREATPVAAPLEHAELAQEEQALVAATGKIVNDLDALAQKSLAAPPQVTALLGEALLRMRDGVRAFEKGNPVAGRAQGEEAYGLLNRAVIELSRASGSSCPKPGSGSSCNQQMQDLMGQQQKLNDMTRQLKESIPNPQNLTPEQRAQMSRLLGEQRSIEDQLRDIERQARERRELLGRLDRMQEEMREVVEDMESEALSDETLRVQERIVSRMLDAQRSLHKRDFNEKRESRTAEDVWSRGGKSGPDSDRVKKLRRDIERALREGTPEEYEELVRQYFRAIAEAEGGEAPAPVP